MVTQSLNTQKYCIGVDWSRHTVDSVTTVVIIDTEKRQVVASRRFSFLTWADLREALHSLYCRWQPSRLLAVSDGLGSAMADTMAGEGVPVQTLILTPDAKETMVERMLAAIKADELTVNRGRRVDSHTLFAAALAWHGVQNP